MKRAARRPVASKEGTRERLLSVTLEAIERHGISSLTVRQVAEAAGANLAAVNYHFRSKEALVAEALEVAMQSFLENCEPLLHCIPTDGRAGLVALLGFLLDGSLAFPGLVRALLYDAFSERDFSGPFPRAFVPIALRLRDLIKDAVPELDGDEAGHRAVMALSAAFFPAFFSGLFPNLGPLQSARSRLQYLEAVAETTLAAGRTSRPAKKHRRGRRAR